MPPEQPPLSADSRGNEPADSRGNEPADSRGNEPADSRGNGPGGSRGAASAHRRWLDAYPPGIPATYPVPDVALPRLLDDAVRDFPARPALVTDDVTLDHATLADRVRDMTLTLADADVGPGDRVLVALPNLATVLVVYLAIWRRGGVVVPVAPDLPGDQLPQLGQSVHARSIVAPRRVARRWVEALPAEDPDASIPTAVALDDDRWLTPQKSNRPWWARLRRHSGLIDVHPDRDEDAPAGITAPTAGDVAVLQPQPDGAVAAYTHANVVAGAFAVRLWIPDAQAGRERLMITQPVTSYVGLMFAVTGLLAAATVILVDDPHQVGRAVEREQPTVLGGATDDVQALAHESDRRDLASLRVMLAAGTTLEPQPAAIVERRSGGARVRLVFGFAGAGAMCAAQPVYGRVVAGSLGLPVTDTDATVVDPDDVTVPLPPNTAGYLAVAGPQVAGTWTDSTTVARQSALFEQFVSMDDDGVLHYHGPAQQFVRRDGMLVALADVEAALASHPAVAAAGVVSADRKVLAAVVAKRREHVDPADLMVHCADGSPLVPDKVIEVDELPHTKSGALDADALRRQLTEGGDAS